MYENLILFSVVAVVLIFRAVVVNRNKVQIIRLNGPDLTGFLDSASVSRVYRESIKRSNQSNQQGKKK